MRLKFILGFGCICALVSCWGEAIQTEIVTVSGAREVRSVELQTNGLTNIFHISRASLPVGLKSVRLTSPAARYQMGTPGYWVNSDGELGTFKAREKDGSRYVRRPHIPFFGVSTPERTWVAIVTGMPFHYSFKAELKKGVYEISMAFDYNMDNVYEDLEVQFIILKGEDANYAGMARAYRQYQLSHRVVQPLAERIKKQPLLEYAVQWPEVRVRQAWKPVPSPVPEQTVKNEPPVKPVITFSRFQEIAQAFKAAGIGGAEFCLVGWNVGGHDGRWPQVFPVEPKLGGEDALRKALTFVKGLGYQVVAHANLRDAYLIADTWDAEYIREKDARGVLKRGNTTWGGGRMYTICPKRAYERFALQQMPMIHALGFEGLHYLDVYSCVGTERCEDARHPLNDRQSAAYTGHILQLARDTFGGVASEGSYDQNAGALDYVLYVSFARPFEEKTYSGLVDRLVPMFQLVYNGIILSNPFTTTVNAPLKGRANALKAIEFGARPTFYYYANFLTPGKGKNWMGDEDLTCDNDEQLRDSVQVIKQGIEAYQTLWKLQYCYMDGHDQIADGVFCTRYSNGAKVFVNYRNEPYTDATCGVIPALDWRVIWK